MPLPIGHSLSAYVFHDALQTKTQPLSWRMLLLFVFVANLPDFDFLPGYFVGQPGLFHRHFLSHSLGAALVIGAFFGALSWLMTRKGFWCSFVLFASLYFSHVFLDLFSEDTSQPYGVPLFWPFFGEYICSPVSIFMSIEKSGDSHSFLQSVFVMHNLMAALWEFVVFVPIVATLKFVKARKRIMPGIFGKRQIDLD